MKNGIYLFFVKVLTVLGTDLFCLIWVFLTAFLGAVLCLLKVFNKLEKTRANAIYLTIAVCNYSFNFLVTALTLTDIKAIIFYTASALFLTAIISVVYLSFYPKKEEDQDLIELIDREIEKEELPPFSVEKIRVQEEKKQDRAEVDFTHVKNVIERLDYYNLSATEKKQVKNLKETVYLAENEGVDGLTRQKINDGLSDLLKIMSRHGV